MLRFIHQQQKVSVTELYQHFKIEQSLTSQHLSKLRRARLVNSHRVNRYVYYSVNYEMLQTIHDIAIKLII